MPTDDVIKVERLTKFYGRTRGVDKLDFTVRAGEIFGFLGPNGAGKTTTIRLLLHLLHATSGTISVFDEIVGSNPVNILKRCGYLPGQFSAYGQMTGAEYLRFTAGLRNADPGMQQHLIDRFELGRDDLSKKIKQLSQGTLQKLGIIQAFFHTPELLILDEPTSGLDPLMQEEFYRLLRECRDAGSTMFFSSHNLPEVEKICSRVAIIRAGRVVALETLDDLKKKLSRRLELTLREHVEHVEIPHTQLLEQRDMHYTFRVQGDIETLLQHLTTLPIENIVFPEPDLEEVFMAYYA